MTTANRTVRTFFKCYNYDFKAISEGADLDELAKKQEAERMALDARFESEEARQVGEMHMKLNEEHKEQVKQAHKDLLEKVRYRETD